MEKSINHNQHDKGSSYSSYKKLALNLSISFVVMYGVMFLNADLWEHVMLSFTRTYMTVLMIAPMTIIMILMMGSMYKNKKLNAIIIGTAIVVFFGTLALLRYQVPIKDIQWMKAMIPHHSSAIMVSQGATFEDPEVAKLAKEIIEAQKKEIAQMKAMISRIQNQD